LAAIVRSHRSASRKIERWHQTLKNRILLENYYLPGGLEWQIGAFVEHYNHIRYHKEDPHGLADLRAADAASSARRRSR
jgi:hypothetical protein